ncbi:hypothetical protein N0V82_006153 [Gnomoniopsis sp. IMI 355080]|nr:hypothetical protein N0V82_006153 [Gnomoniopsis sp. IMI 355080]
MDGVNGVTQCPIAQGDHFTYRWRALQYGHTWYHSHYALQYADGAVGPLIIHGPNSEDWDIDLGPVLIQDYVHETSFIAYEAEKTQTNFARADSIVVNGLGHDPATGTGSYFNTKFTPGKKHLLRLVNSSAGTTFIFSIDNHPFKVVANDLVAIEPFTTTSLTIGIGQRYTIIVEADQEPANYWIRTHPATRCNGFAESLGTCNGTTGGTPGVFDDNCVLFDVRTAIVSYDSPDITNTTLPSSTPFVYSVACLDEPAKNLKPVVPWVIDNRPANNITRDRFTLGRQNAGLNDSVYEPGGYQHWEFTPDFFWIDFENPTILNTSFQGEFDKNFHVIDEPYDSGFIFMVFEASPMSPTPSDVTVIPISHPIHWHGHDVVVLAQNQSQFDPDESFAYFNFDNPPRRDVVLLPEQGYIAIAMRADNPGAWLIHCHIAWHSSGGLAMQNLESQSTIVNTLGGASALNETQRVCDNWRKFNDQHPILQDESGI